MADRVSFSEMNSLRIDQKRSEIPPVRKRPDFSNPGRVQPRLCSAPGKGNRIAGSADESGHIYAVRPLHRWQAYHHHGPRLQMFRWLAMAMGIMITALTGYGAAQLQQNNVLRLSNDTLISHQRTSSYERTALPELVRVPAEQQQPTKALVQAEIETVLGVPDQSVLDMNLREAPAPTDNPQMRQVLSLADPTAKPLADAQGALPPQAPPSIRPARDKKETKPFGEKQIRGTSQMSLEMAATCSRELTALHLCPESIR